MKLRSDLVGQAAVRRMLDRFLRFLTFPFDGSVPEGHRVVIVRVALQYVSTLAVWIVLAAGLAAANERKAGRLKVFILAGQSNMVGAGVVKMDLKRNEGKGSLEHLVKNEESTKRFQHVVDGEGQWVKRDDVWIWNFGKAGPLTVGFGGNGNAIGPELGFGHRVGEALREPVLLIKIAWGGKSLAKDFRPPSSGGEVGPFYRELLMHVKNVLGDLKKHYPAYKEQGYKEQGYDEQGYDEQGYELAGFGWHQGWNDRINQAYNDAYEQNMANFIRDIRKDLGVDGLPFVIAETGMSGHGEKHPRALSLMKAQAAVAEHAEFKGNVAFVGTKDYYRPKDESPSGQAYHWNNNAETYFLIGDGMAAAMLRLLKANHSKGPLEQ